MYWCDTNQSNTPAELNDLLNDFTDNLENRTEETMRAYILESTVNPLLYQFRVICSDTSPTFRLWNDYLTKGSIPMKLFLGSQGIICGMLINVL